MDCSLVLSIVTLQASGAGSTWKSFTSDSTDDDDNSSELQMYNKKLSSLKRFIWLEANY